MATIFTWEAKIELQRFKVIKIYSDSSIYGTIDRKGAIINGKQFCTVQRGGWFGKEYIINPENRAPYCQIVCPFFGKTLIKSEGFEYILDNIFFDLWTKDKKVRVAELIQNKSVYYTTTKLGKVKINGTDNIELLIYCIFKFKYKEYLY